MILTIKRGDHQYMHGYIKSRNADGTTGDPIDITGYTIWFTAKRNLTDPDGAAVLALSSPSNGVAITDGPAGFFGIAIAPYQTASLPDRERNELFYDLQIKNTIGQIQTLSRGKLIVEGDVTKAVL